MEPSFDNKRKTIARVPVTVETRVAFVEHCALALLNIGLNSTQSTQYEFPLILDQKKALFEKLALGWNSAHAEWGRTAKLNINQYRIRDTLQGTVAGKINQDHLTIYEMACMYPLALQEIKELGSITDVALKLRLRAAKILIEKVEHAHSKCHSNKPPTHSSFVLSNDDAKGESFRFELLTDLKINSLALRDQRLSAENFIYTNKNNAAPNPLLGVLCGNPEVVLVRLFNSSSGIISGNPMAEEIMSTLIYLGAGDLGIQDHLSRRKGFSSGYDKEVLLKLLPGVEEAYSTKTSSNEYVLIKRRLQNEQREHYTWIRIVHKTIENAFLEKLEELTPQAMLRQTILVENRNTRNVEARVISGVRDPVAVDDKLATTIVNYLPIDTDDINQVIGDIFSPHPHLKTLLNEGKEQPFTELMLSLPVSMTKTFGR